MNNPLLVSTPPEYGGKVCSPMRDTSRREKEFESHHTIRGLFKDDKWGSKMYVIYILSVLLVMLFGLAATITGTWTLIQSTSVFFPAITTQASISMVLSVLVIIVGVLVFIVIIGFAIFVKYERASISTLHTALSLVLPFLIKLFLGAALVAVGIAAGGLIPSLSERIETNANASLFTIHDSQGTMDAWNSVQSTLRCCGVVKFSDYEQVFNNFSVPVSCCNTTNPLVNETTCTDICMNTNTTNITKLLYTEGCAPQLTSLFQYILSVIAGFGISLGTILMLGEMYLLSLIGFDLCFVRCYGLQNDKLRKTHRYFQMIIGVILVHGIAFIPVAVWALTQDLYFNTTPASKYIVVLSVLLMIAGGVMTATGMCQLIAAKALKSSKRILCSGFYFICLCILPMLLITLAVSIAAAGMSGPTVTELNSTLHNYLDDQSIQETWNALQQNMNCCGVNHFTDYETVFNNFSVPVSCCNTTNPLASDCPDIVQSTQQIINQTGLLYSDGCVSHLDKFFNNIFRVTATASITIASLLLAAVFIYLWCFSIVICADYIMEVAGTFL